MTIKDYFQDTGPISVGLWLGKHCSLRGGRRLAAFAAGIISAFQTSRMMQAIKANQWVVSDGSLNRAQLVERSKEVTRNIVLNLFEYFYYYQHIDEARQRVVLSPEMEAMLEDCRQGQLQIILGPHLGNFDLFGMMLVKMGLKVVVLSFPKPNQTYLAQNKLREQVGMRIMPINLSAFREAKRLMLKEGYSFVTGLDRPIDSKEDQKYKPAFFGRPTNLSTYYVRLARETGASRRVRVVHEDGSLATLHPANSMMSDLTDDIVLNAGKILREAEGYQEIP